MPNSASEVRSAPPVSFRFILSVIAGVALLLIVASTKADTDLWGHLRFGLDLLEQGQLDGHDPYSFTSDRPWINHEWLSELAFAVAWRTGGNAGLIALKLLCMLGALGIVAILARRESLRPASQAIVLGLTLLGIFPRSTLVRPQLFSVLLFAALLYVCDSSERRDRRVLLWSIPLICVWANLHGGWIVGLATLTLWTLGLWWIRRGELSSVGLFAVPLLAAAATLLNPYGAGLWTFLLETVRLGREGITEWGPIWTNVSRLLVWAVLAAAVAICAVRYQRANPARILISIAWGAAAFKVNRLDAFFTLAAVVLLMSELKQVLPEFRAVAPGGLSRTARVAIIAAASLLSLAIPGARRALSCVDVTPSWWPEPDAIEFAHSKGLAGRMVTSFEWGEYGIWHLPRAVKVSFDGRRETVYSDAIITGHLQLFAGTPDGWAFLEALDADYVWLPADFLVVRSLPAHGWTPIFTGPRSMIFARSDRVAGAGVIPARAEYPASRCFPGP